MKLPKLVAVQANLKDCLLLKADDLFFTLGAPDGFRLRNEFIGIDINGLADEHVSPEDLERVDLSRFEIYRRVRLLHEMLEGRCLSVGDKNIPDAEVARQDGLEFLEYFLSTLPTVAMGGYDMTSAARREVRDVYAHAYAWLNLIDAICNAFYGDTSCELTVADLSLLSGLDRRTVQNCCGPANEIRTTVGRQAKKERKSVDPAFVTVDPFDAIAWLCSRPKFSIQPIDLKWIERRFFANNREAGPQSVAVQTRGTLIAALVNGTKLRDLVATLKVGPHQCREWYDHGLVIPAEPHASLMRLLSGPQ